MIDLACLGSERNESFYEIERASPMIAFFFARIKHSQACHFHMAT
jgi:hypothetical protein